MRETTLLIPSVPAGKTACPRRLPHHLKTTASSYNISKFLSRHSLLRDLPFPVKKQKQPRVNGTVFLRRSILTLTRSLSLLLALYAGLFVMLTLTHLGENAGARALPFKTLQSAFQGLILFYSDLRHFFPLPSPHSPWLSPYTRRMATVPVLYCFHFPASTVFFYFPKKQASSAQPMISVPGIPARAFTVPLPGLLPGARPSGPRGSPHPPQRSECRQRGHQEVFPT